MERGDGLNRFHRDPKSSCGLSIQETGDSSSGKAPAAPAPPANSKSDDPNNAIATNANDNAAANASDAFAARQPCLVVHEQGQYLPIANVVRIMRRILPPHAKISEDSKEIVQECVSEFISFVTGEANEHCKRERRKTISAEDLMWALGKLGFDDYVEPITLYLNRYRESANERTRLRPEPVPRNLADCGSSMMVGPYGAEPAPAPAPVFHHIGQGHLQGMYEVPPTPPSPMARGFLWDGPAEGASGSGAAGAGSSASTGSDAGGGASSPQPSDKI